MTVFTQVRLDQVAEVRLGRQRAPKNHSGDQMRPYLRAANVGWAGLQLDDVKQMNFTDAELRTYRLIAGDLLLSEASGSPGEVGKPALWSGEIEDCAFQNTLLRVRPYEHEPLFLLHYFRFMALSGRFVPEARGVGINHLGRARLADWAVPLPDRWEQRRIVEILEEHLSRLDAADRLFTGIDTRCYGVLSASLIADLLPGEARGVLSDPPALLGSDNTPRHALPTGWTWRRWADVGVSKNGKPFPSREYQEDGVRLLRPGNLSPHGRLVWTSKNTRSLPANYLVSHSSSLIAPGTIVMNLTAQSLADDFLGRACLVADEDVALLNQRLAQLTPVDVSPLFALAVFRSGLFRHYVKSLSTGSLIQHMFTKQVDKFWLPVPPMSVQRSVTQRVVELEESLLQAAGSVSVQRGRSAGLRRALLTAAFEGKLTGRHTDVEVIEEVARV